MSVGAAPNLGGGLMINDVCGATASDANGSGNFGPDNSCDPGCGPGGGGTCGSGSGGGSPSVFVTSGAPGGATTLSAPPPPNPIFNPTHPPPIVPGPGASCSPDPGLPAPWALGTTGYGTTVFVEERMPFSGNIENISLYCEESGETQSSPCGGITFFFDSSKFGSHASVHIQVAGGQGENCTDSSTHNYTGTTVNPSISSPPSDIMAILVRS